MLNFELCDGEDLPICEFCKRLSSRYPDGKHPKRIPHVQRNNEDEYICPDWLSLPKQEKS